MVSFPNAKINIGLNILSKREDGYHNLSSVFYPVPFEDVLEILPSDTFHFEITGLKVQGNKEDNLVVKAYHLLKKDYHLPHVHIHLHKAIPMGAGLGGGSADAAFTIRTLNDVFELSIPEEKMEEYAVQLGSDCPFFIRNKPALAEGTGNVLSDISIDLTGKYLVLICPDIHVSSAMAYRAVKPAEPEHSVREIIENAPLAQWKSLLHNDFEQSVFNAFPGIREIKVQLYASSAVYASMTGSGSCVYGIFEDKPASLSSLNISWEGLLP